MEKSKLVMGVINLTPNSFAKSNKFNDSDSFANAFLDMKKWADIIDIGAESTAPFNDKIEAGVELKRFEDILFPFLEQGRDPELKISIDTYKIETFKKVSEKIHKHWPKSEIIFNDVSGKIDDELMLFFKEGQVPFTYVFSHNVCPSREETNNHMNYVVESSGMSFLKELSEFFITGINKLKGSKVKFLIDPCFGFSKSREQNHFLLKQFNTFLLQIPTDIGCVYGISRKSFLRFPQDMDVNDPQNISLLDQTQTYFFADLIRHYPKRKFLFRVHSPESVIAAKNICTILK